MKISLLLFKFLIISKKDIPLFTPHHHYHILFKILKKKKDDI